MTLHIILTAIAGLALMAAIIGSALGYWRIGQNMPHHSQVILRFGMAVAGVSCICVVLSSWLMGATWRERVHWELAVDAGFALLSVGLLAGMMERALRSRRATRHQDRQGYARSEGD